MSVLREKRKSRLNEIKFPRGYVITQAVTQSLSHLRPMFPL